MSQRPLGDNQKQVLLSLDRHGSFHARGGWVWNSYNGTIKILDSLVKRGLVEVVSEEVPASPRGYQPAHTVPKWILTPAGAEMVVKLKTVRTRP